MCSSPSPVLSAQRRVWQYWYADGLAVLVAGAGSVATALPLLVMQTHSRAGTLKTILLSVAMVLYAVLLLGQPQIVDWLKSKLIYPRTGYVLNPSEQKDLTVLSLGELNDERNQEREKARTKRKKLAVFRVVLFMGIFLTSAYLNSRLSILIAGLLIGLALGKEKRLPWPAIAVFPFMGLYLAVSPVAGATAVDHLVYLFFGAGLIFILLGLAMFVRYLVAYRAAKSDQ